MRKIIDEKTYDTQTAKKVGSRCYDLSHTDFNWIEETLYQKKTKEYFLLGEGGARTIYCENAVGGGWIGGKRIIPLSQTEAEKWLASEDFELFIG